MSADAEGSASGSTSAACIVLFALVLLLPSFHLGLFGWTWFMIPTMVLFYQYRWRNGLWFAGAGLLGAAIVSALASALDILLFSAALTAAGYSLAQSGFRGDSAVRSGIKATVVLTAGWLLLLALETVVSGVNPVTDFLGTLDHNLTQALGYYRQSEGVTPETLAVLEETFYQTKTVLPKVLASIMVGLALVIVWSTMLISNRLVLKYTGYRPWPAHQTWRLPDRLIWLFIAAAAIALLPVAPLRIAGSNLLICLGLIYLFQGFAVLSFYLHRWKVPRVLRFVLYAMMLLQSFGSVLLLLAGIADVWLDLRRLKKKPEDGQDT